MAEGSIPSLENPAHKPGARSKTLLQAQGQDSGELTPRSRLSWANQVEDDADASGWTSLKDTKDGIKAAVTSADDASKKTKKKKKKKVKKDKALSPPEDMSSPAAAVAGQNPGGEVMSSQSVVVAPASSKDSFSKGADHNGDSKGQNGGVTRSPSGGWARALPDSSRQSVGPKDRAFSTTTNDNGVSKAGEVSTVQSPGGNWDSEIPAKVDSNWDSGWEVAGSRRGKRGDKMSAKSHDVPNVSQKGRGGGQQFQQRSVESAAGRGTKQRSGEWEKPGRGGRSAGGSFHERGERFSPRSAPAPTNQGPNRQGGPPIPSAWGKPIKNFGNSVSNWDSPPTQGSSSELSYDHNGNISTKGGFPEFSGNGSSVFDDYPASLYSDSQISDEEFDSDTMSLNSLDSEESHKSHTTQRANKWFRNFFQDLDVLTEEQVHEHDRQWHCPACQGGVGAIDWYRGLQPLLAHAKTVRSKRVKLHKVFAEVLEEEIRIRGAAPGTHGSGKYGKWRGLGDEHESKDTMVVWPPMIVVRNTQLEQDEDDKWIGMGNKELLDLFKKHNPVKARHAYGPQGHRGISVLIFAESPTGYYNAQRLDRQFHEARRGKENWDFSGKLLFQPGGDRILYGYMATREDLELFNKHSKGKQNLKWDYKSLQEMVLSPMKRLDENNNKVNVLQDEMQREREATRTLKKTVSVMSKKLVLREEELQVIRGRAKQQHEQQQIQMKDMETLYKEKIDQLKQEILEKEAALEKVHEDYEHEHLQKCEQLEQQASMIPKDKNLSVQQQQEQALMEKEIERYSQLVEMCIKNQEEWEASKVELLQVHHLKMMTFKSNQWEELIKFEQALEKERVEVMEKFKLPIGN